MTATMESSSSSPTTTGPQSSMTLSISREVAQRMLTASKALNSSVARLKAAEQRPENSTNSTTCKEDDSKENGVKHSEEQDAPKRVVSVSDSGSVSSSDENPMTGTATNSDQGDPDGFRKVLLRAASECGEVLIDTFLSQMREAQVPEREIETCLVLFLDMDKSTKLQTAFNLLAAAVPQIQASDMDTKEQGGKPDTVESSEPKSSNELEAKSSKSSTDSDSPFPLDLDSAAMLFKSFLTSISICIHCDLSASAKRDSPSSEVEDEKPRKALKENSESSPTSSTKSMDEEDADAMDPRLPSQSPSFDSAAMGSSDSPEPRVRCLSEETVKEIQEIAVFAANSLMQHVQKGDKGASLIHFEAFGNWYNSGGFSIVPWLELLDLAKWDSVGETTEENKVPDTQPKTVLTTIKEEPQSTPAEKPPTPPSAPAERKPSPPNFFKSNGAEPQSAPTSRILVSFDFTGAMSSEGGRKRAPFSISITEENLLMLHNLVYRTGLASRSPEDVCQILLRHSTERVTETGSVMVLHRDDFGKCIRDLVPPEASLRFSSLEMESFSTYFINFFTCFESGAMGKNQVNVKELAVGFSFLCAGNKSSKLAAGFELLNDGSSGKLKKQQLSQYLRSYLTMLAGISLLSGSPAGMAEVAKILKGSQREKMITALDNGAKWTLGHFIKDYGKGNTNEKLRVSFEDFARWYTDGGFNIAPWLELLDLSKLLSLLGDAKQRPPHSRGINQKRSSNFSFPEPLSPKHHRHHPSAPPVEVLFTFPLANNRSLVVLKEDATYVRSVVEKLGLLNLTPEDVWSSLFESMKFQPPRSSQSWSRSKQRGVTKTMDVDQATFVSGMEGVIANRPSGRKRPANGSAKVSTTTKETLVNFFHSFDLEQVDHVSLNQLMGGLTLLCGGKKSTKLAFAFGLFDNRNDGGNNKNSPGSQRHSLDGEELFLFLRSFLIVMFSCCRQSLDLSAEAVGRYIADTSHMVTENVMRYQWHTSKRDRVDFDEFGEWYNEGGFETAPWLELLDLQKWVLVDNVETVETRGAPSTSRAPPPSMQHPREGFRPSPHSLSGRSPQDFDCPPPPPDDAVDPSFFGDDENGIMPLGSMDEMDYILMQQPSQDKENDGQNANRVLLPVSPQRASQSGRGRNLNSLKFHLVTNEDHGGYVLSISQRRVRHIRHVLLESALCQIDSELACKKILSKASRIRTNGKLGSKKSKKDEEMLALSKDDFDSAMRSIIAGGRSKPNMSPETQRTLSDLLGCVFTAFDRLQNGMPSAMEVACGFSVLCSGKKSDKLEYAFELLDTDKDGKLSRRDMANYLRSFLTTLLSVASAPCLDVDENEDMISLMNGNKLERNGQVNARAVDAGSSWAASQAFKSGFKGKSDRDSITFDDFAEWYTNIGYSSIPWLELLDLRKWVLVET